ncbi:hypothetical protein [Idiomarina abyssalis]|uniref:hypothetical protein n=1 Tax=Idiomarina abyssalis TaxID=86102 RepID=UPI003A9351AE
MFLAEANEDTRADQGYFDRVTSSTWETVKATADEAWKQSPLSSILRMDELRRTEAVARENELKVDPEKLNKDYGGLGLKFDKEEYQSVASLIADRKRAELRRKAILEQSDDSLSTTGLKFATGLAVSMADPINIGASFIPIVGEARFARMVASIGVNKARVARGVIEGSVGAAIVEPVVLAAAMQEQADYDFNDSLMNLAFGTVMGGGLHLGAGKLKDKIDGWQNNLTTEERALFFNALQDDKDLSNKMRSGMANQLERLKPETRNAMLRVAVSQTLQGNPIHVEALAKLDPNLRKEMFDTAHVLDRTLDKPVGPANEVGAVLEANGVSKVLLEKGPAIEKDGEIKVNGRALKRTTGSGQGYGMVKIIWRHGEKSSKSGTSEQITRDDIFHTIAVLKEEPFDAADNRAVWFRERDDEEIVKYVVSQMEGNQGNDGRLVSLHVLTSKEKEKLMAEGNLRRGFNNGILKRDTASSHSSTPPNSTSDHDPRRGFTNGILSQDTSSLRSDGQPIKEVYQELADNATKSDLAEPHVVKQAKEYAKTAPEEVDLDLDTDSALEEAKALQKRLGKLDDRLNEFTEIEQELKKAESLESAVGRAVSCIMRS